MGYKLAGFKVIGANDIDPEMAQVYKKNHNPDHYYLKPIGELVKSLRADGVPAHLQDLDILDGSPPCSSFSTAGSRDETWGKLKKFREGQASQVLDDLFFDYLDLLETLNPRAFIAENVTGILKGKAKGYAKEIVKRARSLGYAVQVFEVDATSCGVPQTRRRVFFVGSRVSKSKMIFKPTRKVVPLSEAFEGLSNDKRDLESAMLTPGTATFKLWSEVKPGSSLDEAHAKGSFFTFIRNRHDRPSPTVLASYRGSLHGFEPRRFTWGEMFRIGSFPDDYQLCEPKRSKWNDKAGYLVGMSVPPFMIRDLSRAVFNQWLRA